MTSIYKQEDKHYIYQSEKPFPKREEYENVIPKKLSGENYKLDIQDWFSSAKRIVVKEGEEKRFEMKIFDIIYFDNPHANVPAKMKEGVEIPSSCYKVEGKFSCSLNDCDCVLTGRHVNCDNYKIGHVAVFVDSVPHAKGKVTEDIEQIFAALKVKDLKSALEKIDMFTTYNEHDVKVIEQLRKEIKALKQNG
jgi:SAM-dependent methyltransferase